MRGNSLHGNRETPKASAAPNAYQADGGVERPEKALGRTAGMPAFGESDGSIVPKKQANKWVTLRACTVLRGALGD